MKCVCVCVCVCVKVHAADITSQINSWPESESEIMRVTLVYF